MKGIDLMNSDPTHWVSAIALVVLGFCLTSGAKNSSSVQEAEFSTKIVGRWKGAVGDEKETMSLEGDGTFVCQLQTTGFIANTLSQGVTGKVRGTWRITGPVLALRITGSENEHLRNRVASSTIVAFKGDKLVLKSDRGDTSLFHRAISL